MNIEDLKTEGESYLGEGGTPHAARNYQEPSAPSYEPITTWEDLMDYGVTRKIVNGVEVEVETIPEVTLIEKTLPMSTAFSDIKVQVSGRRFRSKSCPRTLVCHDCKTNYKDDKYVLGTNNPESYYFRHWLQTDIFCYFAHHFVTIPPLGWINAAHKHGVQCIGTIITEPGKGENLCKELLRDQESREKAVKKLCMVAQHYGFDGYLVNIENHINEGGPTEYGKKKAQEMIEFVRLLRENIKSVNPNAVVIWYDCLGLCGRINREYELNEKNKPFFDACDGFFLDYDWTQAGLLRSVKHAGDRVLDVFVGVDVWGGIRTRRGIGGVLMHEIVKMAADCGLSVAIFAPGWAFEKHLDEFPKYDNELWMNCAKYFYFRTLKVSDYANETAVDGGVVSVPQSGDYQVIISTDFSLGLGQRKFLFGKEKGSCETTEGCPWFNLNKQSFQPALNCFRSSKVHPNAEFQQKRGFLGGVSLSIPAIAQDEIEYASPLWMPLHVSLGENVRKDAGAKYAAIVMVAWQNNDLAELKIDATGSNHPIKVFFEFTQPTEPSRKVMRLSNVSEQIGLALPKKPVTIPLKRCITQSQLCHQDDPIPDVNLVFDNAPYAEAVVNDWKISGFMMDMNDCIDWDITALRLGAVTPVNVGLLSLALLAY